ncbi:hypothetical protein CUS_8010 [Ruminococcus albus 8]|uniref:Uncharacterized protein n=1 Tax=Ruminococcus albus 8 TaxID=246199 RepID=E9SAP8_RUMAL|nr:hypothetical protein CUS_8010 [Ruminococcus albus 8]
MRSAFHDNVRGRLFSCGAGMMQSPHSKNALRRRPAGASAEGGVIYGGYLRDIS